MPKKTNGAYTWSDNKLRMEYDFYNRSRRCIIEEMIRQAAETDETRMLGNIELEYETFKQGKTRSGMKEFNTYLKKK